MQIARTARSCVICSLVTTNLRVSWSLRNSKEYDGIIVCVWWIDECAQCFSHSNFQLKANGSTINKRQKQSKCRNQALSNWWPNIMVSISKDIELFFYFKHSWLKNVNCFSTRPIKGCIALLAHKSGGFGWFFFTKEPLHNFQHVHDRKKSTLFCYPLAPLKSVHQ